MLKNPRELTEADLNRMLMHASSQAEEAVIERMLYHIKNGNSVTMDDDERLTLTLKPSRLS